MKRSIKTMLVAVIVSLSLAAPVLAGPYEDGMAVCSRGDYAMAAAFIRKPNHASVTRPGHLPIFRMKN